MPTASVRSADPGSYAQVLLFRHDKHSFTLFSHELVMRPFLKVWISEHPFSLLIFTVKKVESIILLILGDGDEKERW